jgi:hypothetical protein
MTLGTDVPEHFLFLEGFGNQLHLSHHFQQDPGNNLAMGKKSPDVSQYRSRHYLLTRGELAFFRALKKALGDRWLLFAKVRLADVVTCSDSLWDQGPGRRIAQKHLDFVVCHPGSLRIVAAIELDDRSHARLERRQRDTFLNRLFRSAGIPLLRYPARAVYDIGQLTTFWNDSDASRRRRLRRNPHRR